MEMIEVRVRNQHDIHWRQFAQIQSRLTQTLQNEKPAREVGIDDDVLSANLQKKTGVPDKGHAELAIRSQGCLMGLARTRRDHGMAHQASKLPRTLTQRPIFLQIG